MKRTTVLLTVLLAFGWYGAIVAPMSPAHASTSHTVQAKKHHKKHHKCKKHGYKHGKCRRVLPGETDTLAIPGLGGVFLTITGVAPHGIEVVIIPVANLCPSIKHAVGIRIIAFDPVTGDQFTTFNPPLKLNKGHAYFFNHSLGKCEALPTDSQGMTSISRAGIYAITKT